MSASDLKGELLAEFAANQRSILGVVAAAVVLLVLFVFIGGQVLGGLLFFGWALLWLAVGAFVIWLFYRLVVALERIAGAQERMATAQFQAELEETDDTESETETDETGTQTTLGKEPPADSDDPDGD